MYKCRWFIYPLPIHKCCCFLIPPHIYKHSMVYPSSCTTTGIYKYGTICSCTNVAPIFVPVPFKNTARFVNPSSCTNCSRSIYKYGRFRRMYKSGMVCCVRVPFTNTAWFFHPSSCTNVGPIFVPVPFTNTAQFFHPSSCTNVAPIFVCVPCTNTAQFVHVQM